jgi:hypothetical protein
MRIEFFEHYGQRGAHYPCADEDDAGTKILMI